MKEYHQRPLGRLGGTVLGRQSLDDVEANPVGVHLEMAPWTVDARHRRIGWGHYQPDGSAVEAGRASPVVGVMALPSCLPLGVSAVRVSLTDAMVCCGPRIRRTFR